MKKYILIVISVIAIFTSCTKSHEGSKAELYVYTPAPAKPISDSVPLCGSIAGTMLTGHTYTVNCDIYVNRGDSLTIQPGVTINFLNKSGLIVQGNLFALGSQSQPIYFTVPNQTKTSNSINFDASKDSAFAGCWKGIIGDTSCKYMILKWAHIEYCGALAGANNSGAYAIEGLNTTDANYAIYFSNGNGYLVLEDSWIYGSVDDAIRVGGNGGKIALLRNTFERCGKTGGDVLNIKAGGVGDMAYNFFIGSATNSLKAANSGAAPGIANCNVNVYNNTLISGGYRQKKTGRGGSINYENGARGQVYNNLIVNCKFGLRLSTNVPDTAFMYKNTGYNFYWADSLSVANQIFPYTPGAVTKPLTTDIPNPFSYLSANYVYTPDAAYDGTKAVQAINPQFFNFTLPIGGGYRLQDLTTLTNTGYKFTLKSTSPCIGTGFTNFSPMMAVPVDSKYGVTTFTLPGKDIGCFQSDGTGNQHF